MEQENVDEEQIRRLNDETKGVRQAHAEQAEIEQLKQQTEEDSKTEDD